MQQFHQPQALQFGMTTQQPVAIQPQQGLFMLAGATQREQIFYGIKAFSLTKSNPGRQFRLDFKRRTAEGWHLVLCQQVPSTFMFMPSPFPSIVAVWER